MMNRQILKRWSPIALFFGIGVAAGISATEWFQVRGAGMTTAIGLGAIAGAFLAWLALFTAAKALRRRDV